jgi:glutamate N-acetyltransferase/amino-acid N-acetyltransferase
VAVGRDDPGVLTPIRGIRLGAVSAGLVSPQRPDLVLFELAEGCACAGVFTRNVFRAAPVQIAEAHLASDTPTRYLLVNSGNANAGMGQQGMQDALACCESVADNAGCAIDAVVPYSTGVIGERLAVESIVDAIPHAIGSLRADGWIAAASAMATTDTRPKGATETVALDHGLVTLTGIAKGAGMIRPDMATMLAFMGTDAEVPRGLLCRALEDAVGVSFNRITIDGDTSTNDACTLVATGQSGVSIAERSSADYKRFAAALTRLCTRLAQSIVRDGEGATRFVTITVQGAANQGEAEAVGRTLAESPLVKTAIGAGDPNWGRLLAAVGRAGVPGLTVETVRIWVGDYLIVQDGGRVPGYDEAEAAARMADEDVAITVDLGRGDSEACLWTCDLTAEYVRINAEYRS